MQQTSYNHTCHFVLYHSQDNFVQTITFTITSYTALQLASHYNFATDTLMLLLRSFSCLLWLRIGTWDAVVLLFAENKWNPPFIEKSVWERDHLLCLLMIDDEALPCCSECRMNWALEIDENWESMKRPWSWYCCWVVALTIRTPDLIPYFVASTFPLLVLGITWALSFLSEAHSHTTTIQVFSFVLEAWHSFVVAFSLKNVWKNDKLSLSFKWGQGFFPLHYFLKYYLTHL